MIDRPDKKAGFCSCSAAFSDRASAKTHTNTKNTEMKTTTKIKTKIKIKKSHMRTFQGKIPFQVPCSYHLDRTIYLSREGVVRVF